MFEVGANGSLHREEDGSEEQIWPSQRKDGSAEDAAAVLLGVYAEAPFGGFEIASVAIGAGELDGAAADRINIGDAVRHLAALAVAGVAARMREGVELETHAGRSAG